MGERELQQSLGRSNTEFLTASRRHSNVPKRDPSFVYHAPEEQGWLPHETFEISEEVRHPHIHPQHCPKCTNTLIPSLILIIMPLTPRPLPLAPHPSHPAPLTLVHSQDFEEAFIKADLEDVGYISGEKELVILLNDVFKGCLRKEQREDILNLFEDKSKVKVKLLVAKIN